MHRIRLAVRENRLADPAFVTEQSYLPYLAAGCAWVAVSDREVVGFAILDPDKRQIWALFVDPSAEGAGLGTKLHERMLAFAAAKNISHLSLTTTPGTRAERFYVAAGWRTTGTTADGDIRLERDVRQKGDPELR